MARSMEEILGSKAQSSEVSAPAPTEQRDVAESAPEIAKDEPAEKIEPAPVKAEKAAEKPAAEDQDEPAEHVPDDLDGLKRALAAARGDKRKARAKHREIELELAALKGRLEASKSAPAATVEAKAPQAPAIPPTVIDLDEETYYSKGPEAVKAYVAAQVRAAQESQAAQVQRQLELHRSEMRAMARHADYGERFATFQQSAPPHVIQQMLSDPDPAEYVYSWASAYDAVKDVGSIDELRERIREEERAKLLAEHGQQPVPQPKVAPPQPQKSIASARGTSAHVSQAWTGPRSLDQILTR